MSILTNPVETVQLPDVAELQQLLTAAGGNYVKAFQNLVQKAERSIAAKEGRSVESRKAQWRKALAAREENKKKLKSLQRAMKDFVGLTTEIDSIVLPSEEPRLLNTGEQLRLMERAIARQEIAEFLEVEREITRELVFDHITKENQDFGVENPENQNGRIEVDEYDRAFCKEGCGQKPPTVNESELKDKLGPLWADVVDTVETTVFSEEKFFKLAANNPELGLLEVLRDCLVEGGWKTPRFTVRTL